LINKYGDTTSSAENTTIRSIAIAKEMKDLVINFYEQDDISCQEPGRKMWSPFAVRMGKN
jgi:hypothetical protein